MSPYPQKWWSSSRGTKSAHGASDGGSGGDSIVHVIEVERAASYWVDLVSVHNEQQFELALLCFVLIKYITAGTIHMCQERKVNKGLRQTSYFCWSAIWRHSAHTHPLKPKSLFVINSSLSKIGKFWLQPMCFQNKPSTGKKILCLKKIELVRAVFLGQYRIE